MTGWFIKAEMSLNGEKFHRDLLSPSPPMGTSTYHFSSSLFKIFILSLSNSLSEGKPNLSTGDIVISSISSISIAKRF
ncbi:unnamed protein product [Rhodiola kirilowii]